MGKAIKVTMAMVNAQESVLRGFDWQNRHMLWNTWKVMPSMKNLTDKLARRFSPDDLLDGVKTGKVRLATTTAIVAKTSAMLHRPEPRQRLLHEVGIVAAPPLNDVGIVAAPLLDDVDIVAAPPLDDVDIVVDQPLADVGIAAAP